ncbi:hypothetical protein NQ314_016184 [Rhamnusium bicolor]|uniref:C2H2-type domain-containing protein n=1 Tax=Rhamnusium bicolor TaxID=1586634 RepID=A0AAV8WWI7_9CUCU|nr:hypothetical protein NQ314_016184 [Rhamnusium bicolor]
MRGSLMVHLRVAHYGFGHHNNDSESCNRKREEVVTINVAESVKEEKESNVELKSLQKSEQVKVQDNKQWECDVCSKMFTTKYFLKKTQKIAYRQRVSYLVHRRIHTGVMPYKCTACDKSFRYKVSQRSHKCPMNPPGSVIRIPDSEKNTPQDLNVAPSKNVASSQNAKCIMSVDFNTGNINFISEEQSNSILYMTTNEFQENIEIQKKSITLNNNEQIEISYNKADLQSAINKAQVHEDINGQNVKITQENMSNDVNLCLQRESDNLQKMTYTDAEKDLFSMVLSPILPEVESLCLNNSSNNSSPVPPNEDDTINIMGEKCLEEFLYGSN